LKLTLKIDKIFNVNLTIYNFNAFIVKFLLLKKKE